MDRLAPGYPVEWEADVLLRDGHPVHLRPLCPDDGERLRAFHAGLSEQTRYFRFFSIKPTLTDAEVEHFTTVDHDRRVAFVVLDAGDFVGVGRYDSLPDGSAEVAFVIRDDAQGFGLGSILLEHLAAAARERGVTRFVAEVLPQNAKMLSTFRDAGYTLQQKREEDVISVAFDIEPTAQSLAVMAAREHRADARSVARLLSPRTVAVVGASRAPGGIGHAILRHLADADFAGDLVAVHPEVDEIAGVRCVRSLAEAGESIDLVVVAVPAAAVQAVVDDAAQAGVHAIVVVSGGFGDAGPEGARLQDELVATVRRTGMRLVGPNALGIMNTASTVRLNASLASPLPRRGEIGFFSQSGALGTSILARMAQRGLGVTTFVSAGNRADISGNDVLQFWQDDTSTSVVLLHLETIGNARKFARIVHRIAETKVVVMVSAGGSGLRRPLGHQTRSTRLTQHAVDDILSDTGLLVVETIDRMLDVAMVATAGRTLRPGAVAVVGNSDALAVMAVNAAEQAGMLLAAEPETFAREDSVERYRDAITAARSDPSVSAVVAIHVPPIERDAHAEVRAALQVLATSGSPDDPPVVLVVPSSAEEVAEVPVFHDVEAAMEAIAALDRFARWRATIPERPGADAVWPGLGARSLPVGHHSGQPALEALEPLPCTVAYGTRPRLGWRVRVEHDPLFGPVVSVGVDDPVAEILEDVTHRLAPVTVTSAHAMIAGLRAGSTATAEVPPGRRAEVVDHLAELIAHVSALPGHLGEHVTVDLRHVGDGEAIGRDLTLSGASVTVSSDPTEADPAARRM